ncbi:DUF3987 domain-containing protein [Vibrio sp. DNB22_10_4]
MTVFEMIFKRSKNDEEKKGNKDENNSSNSKSKPIDESVIKIRPKLPDKGMYGLLHRIASCLSLGTEAHYEAIFASLMSIVSISIPKSKKTMPYAASETKPRLNVLLIAKTGGGKGVSDSQTMSLIKAAEAQSEHDHNQIAPILFGGLASGEGIANALRDSETPELDDKRLVIIEAEFQSVLSKCNVRDSILSSTIRKLYDGESLSSLTKSDPYTCSNPHVGIIGHITPAEFCAELSNKAIANGFANRFPIYCLFKKKGVPFPKVTNKEELNFLAQELNSVLAWANSDEGQLEYSEDYKKRYEEVYEALCNLGPDDSVEQSLMARASHYATMYAMMFAIFDKSNLVTVKHLEAALAWISYWHSSVQYTFNTESAAKLAIEKEKFANLVLDKIKELCKKNNTNCIQKTPLNLALGRNSNSAMLSDALKNLQERPEPPITVTKGKHNKHVITLTNM